MSAVAVRPACILIVDDEPDNIQLLRVILARAGFRIMTACSGEEALASVAREPPDLVLLDIMMSGMDGYEVATRIKTNHATRNIRVVMVSALTNDNARMLAQRAGADDYFTKPMGHAELCQRVRTLLAS